ncbi:hypothetical protein QJV03_09380 [Listeria swaminathanii]|uniref:Uncharacterized protein n=1 Tax=Listeria swaminathanii TaxID=2713501 RepID=A0ABU2IHC2_9LIST|nr:hypothetical protein [Listeria swaminathanii]MDT0017391.1 hypothetical protein [Listeria swaminathanii]MDT0023345.1 hypothetical protein [Listeria swaminathanii]MDT0034287.1 hypothetical protein [Listeria swaminathanii]MDT0053110.1 hypothetical protein [Listeria swaminathanii]MDT0055875.1 hypothetical protein [Listeria swaminathanii]
MTEIKRMLQTKEDNSKEQFYPETHVEGIVGLTEYVSGQLPTGVVSVNGKAGRVLLGADDVYAAKKNHGHDLATYTTDGFMSSFDKQKIDELVSPEAGVVSVNGRTGIVDLFASDVEAADINHSHPDATATGSGFLSSNDKEKLDAMQVIALETIKEVTE